MRQDLRLDADQMSGFAHWLLTRIDQCGTSLAVVAERADVDKSYLYKVLKSYQPQYRQYKRPGFDKTVRVGRVLGDVPGALRSAGFAGTQETAGAGDPGWDGRDGGHVDRAPWSVGTAMMKGRGTEGVDGVPERAEEWPPELLEAMHYSRTLSPDVQRYIYGLWREQARVEAALAQKRREAEAELRQIAASGRETPGGPEDVR